MNLARVLPSAEYSAVSIRELLLQLFPYRKLVLSQLTLFNQAGVIVPSGTTSLRGRRCYRLNDILPIACVLALKEKGIPLKNISAMPELVRQQSERIFSFRETCTLNGLGDEVNLCFGSDQSSCPVLARFLSGDAEARLFWSFCVSDLALQLVDVAQKDLHALQAA